MLYGDIPLGCFRRTYNVVAFLCSLSARRRPRLAATCITWSPRSSRLAAGPLAPAPSESREPHLYGVDEKSRRTAIHQSGVNLAYAFNHAEARRAFREAARLDPNLAMAYWGQALVLGPNINALMEPNEEPQALRAGAEGAVAEIARERNGSRRTSMRSRSAIQEPRRIAHRAIRHTPTAMRAVRSRYPQDLDATMLYVESVMDLRPWGYWQGDGTPHEGIAEIVALTEQVIAKNPRHPGALHMYIHLMESVAPEKAEKAADTLLTLMPAAGHMVHMPAHIYQRVGRYADAMRANQLAIAADEDYIAQCRAQGLYPMAYYPHNIHFLWFSATFDGQSRIAIESARSLAAKIDDEALAALPLLAGFRMIPYYTLTRFGRWEEMLKEPEPPPNAVLRAVWHYARGLSLVATGRAEAAEAELARLRELLADESMKQPLFSPNTAGAALAPAPEMLAGEIAAARGDFDSAIALSLAGGARRRQPGLYRAVRVSFSSAPRARGDTARSRPVAGSRDRLLGGFAPQSGEWLGAVWPAAGASGARQDGQCRPRGGAV